MPLAQARQSKGKLSQILAIHDIDPHLPGPIRRWVIVDGGVKFLGGQDRANLELVRYLSSNGQEVHVVAHDVDAIVLDLPSVSVHFVRRPFRSNFLGERLLEASATTLRAGLGPGTVLVSNGGNCAGDVVWVHSVHAAWPIRDEGAPFHEKAFNRIKKWDARQREAAAFRNAKLIVANSFKTSRDLSEKAGVPAQMIEVLYFGSDTIAPEKRAVRFAPQIAFIGALGWDRNKGLDIAMRAFALLVSRGGFQHRLVVAGAGSSVPWKRLAEELLVADRIDFVGFVVDVPALLAKSDLLISPSRYEAYGLAVQEALSAGVPALVSAVAGITERLPPELESLRVYKNESPEAWALAITRVLAEFESIRASVNVFRRSVLTRTWAEMAAEFVKMVALRVGRTS